MIDSNLIIGNSAESGSWWWSRLQQVNGTEVITTPYNLLPNTWYGVTVQNNIIATNVAGWDGAGRVDGRRPAGDDGQYTIV